MPRGSGSKQPSPVQEKTSGGVSALPSFVSCELNDDQKALIKNQVFKADQFLDTMDTLINEGYKFSFSFDERSNAVAVIGTGQQTSENAGLALSARAPSILAAFSVWCFKHYQLLGEQWSNGASKAKKDAWG